MTDWYQDSSPDEPEVKSKTQIKREMEALQELGKRLLGQKREFLEKLPLSDRLRAALEESYRITQNEAKRRHLQFIGKLMRDVDAETIQEHLDRQAAGTRAHTQHFHQLEIWRDRLIDDPQSLDAFLEAYPQADRQHVRQLARNAQKEASQNKAPASARKLFKYIREVDEQNS